MIYKILICIASIIYLESFSLAQETLVLDAQYHGWKTIKFSKPVREITRITGSWSACATSSCGHDVDWRYVDYRGYRDRDDICHNRDEFKCWVSGDPYLATYVLDDGVRRKITHLPFRLHKRSKTLRISSNDFQRGREVNSGQLRFHFSYYTTSSIKPSMLEKARDSLNFILKKLYTSKDLDIPELDEIDLDNLPDFILNDPDLLSATKRYLEAKQKLAELNEEKATLEENADNNYEDLEELLDTIDKDLDLEDLEEGFEEDLDWEPNEEEDDYLPESNYYTDRADETLQFLQSLFELGDRRGFITAVYQWRLSQAEILPTMEPLAISSPGEWAAFVAAKNSVDTYISTKLDDKGWFLDSPVDNDTRARVEEISELAGSMGKDLALEIQSLASLTDAQKRFLIGLTMLGPALKAAAQDNSGAMGQLMATVGGFLQAFRSGSICLGQSLALGDAGDFYEVATGLDQCTGAKLTASGRLLSGVGFFAGSARLWRAVGRLMGFNVDVAKTVDHIADIQEAAERAGIRNVKGFVESATKAGIPGDKIADTVKAVDDVLKKNPCTASLTPQRNVIDKILGLFVGTAYAAGPCNIGVDDIFEAASKKASDFEASIAKLPPGERVAKVKGVTTVKAAKNNWKKNNGLKTKNGGRDIYTDSKGTHWGVDTQHGHWEKFNKKTGKHEGAYNMDGEFIDGSIVPGRKINL